MEDELILASYVAYYILSTCFNRKVKEYTCLHLKYSSQEAWPKQEEDEKDACQQRALLHDNSVRR